MIVGGSPDQEDQLYGRPFMSRGGILLRKLIREAGIDDPFLTLLCRKTSKDRPDKAALWREIQEVKPRVIVTTGLFPAQVLLAMPKSKRLHEVAGEFRSVAYCQSVIAPWYSETWVLNAGRADVQRTVDFFKRVKERAGVQADQGVVR